MSEIIKNPSRIETSSQPVNLVAARELQPTWLTYREAEILTGLSRVTIWKLIGAKAIKAAKVGRAVRISRQSLEAYMEECAADA
jgi:excisionase family DNA binding protein